MPAPAGAVPPWRDPKPKPAKPGQSATPQAADSLEQVCVLLRTLVAKVEAPIAEQVQAVLDEIGPALPGPPLDEFAATRQRLKAAQQKSLGFYHKMQEASERRKALLAKVAVEDQRLAELRPQLDASEQELAEAQAAMSACAARAAAPLPSATAAPPADGDADMQDIDPELDAERQAIQAKRAAVEAEEAQLLARVAKRQRHRPGTPPAPAGEDELAVQLEAARQRAQEAFGAGVAVQAASAASAAEPPEVAARERPQG